MPRVRSARSSASTKARPASLTGLTGPPSPFAIIYRDSVLKARTRNYCLPVLRFRVTPEILHTLLGIELRLGRKRLLCPDLATARYLAIFARIGLQNVAIPYDITRVSVLADELATQLEMGLLQSASSKRGAKPGTNRGRRKAFLDRLCAELASLGSKPDYPEFEMPSKRMRNPLGRS